MANETTTANHWKTSDIKIAVDSVGDLRATHKWAGLLIDGAFYDQPDQRVACRREAVIVLRELRRAACK
jgi:hypothetical protein